MHTCSPCMTSYVSKRSSLIFLFQVSRVLSMRCLLLSRARLELARIIVFSSLPSIVELKQQDLLCTARDTKGAPPTKGTIPTTLSIILDQSILPIWVHVIRTEGILIDGTQIHNTPTNGTLTNDNIPTIGITPIHVTSTRFTPARGTLDKVILTYGIKMIHGTLPTKVSPTTLV